MKEHPLTTQTPLGELLIQKCLITEGELKDALLEQQVTNKRLGEILIRRRLISFDQLDAVLNEQLETKVHGQLQSSHLFPYGY